MAGTPTPRTVTEVRLPLSAYEPTREQIQTLDDAGRILPTDCLRRFGITGSVPLPPSSRTVVGDMSDRRAALLDEDQAKRYGYRRFTDSSDTGAELPICR